MDRLEFAVRRYRQILPRPVTGWLEVPIHDLRRWLIDDVCPVLEDYVRRPAFRSQAGWSLRSLRPGAGTPERALVEDADAALVACAQALSRFTQLRTVRRRLEAKQPSTASEDALQPSATGQAILLRQVELIADRFWSDLVCPEDYFEPTGGWMGSNPPRRQAGEFVVALSPDLHPGGDFVSRCLWVRADGLRATLDSCHAFCTRLLQPASRPLTAPWQQVGQSWQILADKLAQLRQACLQQPEQPLRDGCVLLTQLYAAFQPQPDVDWLGLPEPVVQRGAAVMRHRFTQTRNGELFERTAIAVRELRGLYRDADLRQNALDEAIAMGWLVVVREPPAVYWDGERLEVEWGRFHKCWDFLRKLAEKAQRGSVVEDRDLYDDRSVSPSTLGTVFHRLKKLIPASLWKHIVPVGDPRGYRLALERSRIHLFP